MALKVFSTIVQQMRSFIRSKSSKLDTSEGTILNDIVISAPSQEFEKMYEQLETIQESQAIDTAGITALEGLANNVGLVRKTARRAEGSITFFRINAPTSDITIPAGTLVSTVSSVSSTAIQFVTTRAVVMFSALAGTYLNPSTGVYEISTDIEALDAGTAGIVGPGTITTIVNSLTGIDGCYNSISTTGGLDSESEEQLRARIVAKTRGSLIGTEDGFLSIVLAVDGVSDATVVGHGDTGRDEFGAVDIYIKGKNTRTQRDVFLSSDSELILSKQPILSDGIVSVISSVSGSVSSSNWSLEKDTGNYGGSVQAQDKLVWGITPPGGTTFVVYNYNGLIEDLQSLFSKTNKDILNTNLLVKWATEIPIDISLNVTLLPGFDAEDVSSLISTEVAQFLDTLSIGEELQQADVARIILNIPGVDDVVLPFTTFQASDASITPNAAGNLDIPSNGYPVAGSILITIAV